MQGKSNETNKTAVFVLVAAIAAVTAYEPWRITSVGRSASTEVGEKLFPDFKDPLAAKSLEIVTFDEDNASLRDFRVAQTNGVWSIPSHNNYPADAREHMAQAATALVDLDILDIASSSPGDQELYGVIAPNVDKLKVGTVGVGTEVVLKDDKDKVLADLIIGKEVKDQPTLRYVRKADRDQIYVVAVKTDKLSTKFEDWIEKDLLKLNAFDVREVELNDYSTQEVVRPDGRMSLGVHPRSKSKLGFDDSKSSWNLIEMTEFDAEGKPSKVELAADEELNTEKLNGLKTALDDLLIVDVEKKPAGLSQDLRASDDFVKNREALQSLADRGFYPASRPGSNELEIFSSEGEADCTTKEGVRYVLRFGKLAGGSGADEKTEDGKAQPSLNRYLFVSVQFDESQIAKPVLEPLPGDKPAAEPAAENKEPAAEAKEPAKEADAADEKPAAEEKPAVEKPADEAAPEQKTADDEAKPAEPAADAKDADAKDADAKAPEAKAPEAPATPEEEQRIAVQKENKRKQDEYDTAIKKGQEKVKELNDRFADWYYIISDDVYKKIHLSRADIVKKKEAEKPAGGAATLPGGVNDLKQFQKGLQP